jgi:hypothetical protein
LTFTSRVAAGDSVTVKVKVTVPELPSLRSTSSIESLLATCAAAIGAVGSSGSARFSRSAQARVTDQEWPSGGGAWGGGRSVGPTGRC